MNNIALFTFTLLAVLCLTLADEEPVNPVVAELAENDTDTDTEDENQIIQNMLVGYKRFVRPKGTNRSDDDGGPTVINVNFFLRRLADIDEDDMNYRVELTFRQQWNDERLVFDKKHVHDDDDDDTPFVTFRQDEASEKIWTPDTFFQNAIEVKDYDLMEPNEMVRIFPNGNVMFSKRVSLTLAQAMDFDDFPFDVHDLFLDISSYSHNEKEIVYKWRDELPIQIKANAVQDLNFKLVETHLKRCHSVVTTGRYSCLRAEFEVERKAALNQLFQFFGPSFVLVVVSWFPFMISAQSIAVRALIGLACLITIILQIALIDDELPNTHEFTWAHTWLITCFAFIVAAQFQLIGYAWLARVRTDRRAASGSQKNAEQQRRSARPVGSTEGHTNEHSAPLLYGKGGTEDEPQSLLCFETIFDLVCLLAFAIAFFIFNCYFWAAAGANVDDEGDNQNGSGEHHSKHR